MNSGGFIAVGWFVGGLALAARQAWCDVRSRVEDVLSRRQVPTEETPEPPYRFGVDAPTDLCADDAGEFASCLEEIRALPVAGGRS